MENGAVAAPSVAEAIAASPVTVVCVSGYAATRSILSDPQATAALSGRTLVQLSTGTPQEAREMEARMQELRASYIDGAILAWPSQIGGVGTTILASGAEDVFRSCEPLLRILAGNFTYMGPGIGAASALFNATLAYLAGNWIGFCYGALIYETEGYSTEEFGKLINGLSGILGAESEKMGAVIRNNDYDHPESTVKTSGEDIERLVQLAAEAGINPDFPRFAGSIFRKAIDAGYGAQEHAAIIKVMRAHVATFA